MSLFVDPQFQNFAKSDLLIRFKPYCAIYEHNKNMTNPYQANNDSDGNDDSSYRSTNEHDEDSDNELHSRDTKGVVQRKQLLQKE
jgi:hypothetical protein